MAIQYEYVHHWEGNGVHRWNGTAMQIQQIRLRQGNVLLLSLCESASYNEYGEEITSYITEEMAKWFYEKAVPLCYRNYSQLYLKHQILQSSKRFIYRMNKEVAWYQDQHNRNENISVSLLFIIETSFFIIQMGDLTMQYISNKQLVRNIINRKMKCKKSSYIGGGKQYEFSVITGKIRKKSGIIMASPTYFQYTSNESFQQQYNRIIKSQTKMQKLLSEISTRNRSKNIQTQLEAIMIWRK